MQSIDDFLGAFLRQQIMETKCVVQVMSIVFDKTGTLTHGVQRVSHVVMFVPRTDISLQTVLAIAGSAESSSEHPIGAAIVSYVKKVFFFVLVTPVSGLDLAASCSVYRWKFLRVVVSLDVSELWANNSVHQSLGV